MSDGPALSEQTPPAPAERGPAPTARLATETIVRLEAMAATILAGSIAMAQAEIPGEQNDLALGNPVRYEKNIEYYRAKRGRRTVISHPKGVA